VFDPDFTPARRGRVLLAEDYEPNALFIAEVLDMAGYEVELVTDGCVAVERAGAEVFCAIIMDIEMPQMDGIAATRAIRKHEALAGQAPVPILGITGHTMASMHHLCRMAGMTDIMCKPFRPSILEARLEAAIREPLPAG
jgi:hypothetical protein